MATDYNNRLITPDLEKAMKDYPLYSQDSKKKDALCIAVFYLGNIRWYIMEGQQEGNDFTLYGIVTALQCFSSAVHVGTFLKDSESTTILFFSASS